MRHPGDAAQVLADPCPSGLVVARRKVIVASLVRGLLAGHLLCRALFRNLVS